MSKGLSPQEGTIESTYIDLGAQTQEAYEISSRSRNLARQTLGNATVEDRVRQRCSIAVGDFAMAELISFQGNPVQAGLTALSNGANIITDIRMVQVGVQTQGHHSKVLCALDFGQELAKTKGITRTSAGFLELRPYIEGSIVLIGNAPSALLSVCKMIREEGVRPALIIGMPVGFVNAAESKNESVTLDISAISNMGTRGGTPVAVAAMNEIVTIFNEECHAGSSH